MDVLDIDTYKKFFQTLVNSHSSDFEFDEYSPYDYEFIYEKGTKLFYIQDRNYRDFLYWIYDTFVVSTVQYKLFYDHNEVIDFLYREVKLSKLTYLIRDTKFIKSKITRTCLPIEERWRRLEHIIKVYNSY